MCMRVCLLCCIASGAQQAVELFEITASGIRQNWASLKTNPYRVPVVADYKGNRQFTQACDIPFRYGGTWYKNCTTVPNELGASDQPWCYLRKDQEGNGVAGEW